MLISELMLLAAVVATPQSDIDRLLEKTQQEHGVSPVGLCSDDLFLRRVSLDLIGRIPTREELHRFRADSDRRAKIDELLASDEFSKFWAETWTTALVGYQTQAFNVSREPLRAWLENSLRNGLAYDDMAAATAAGEALENDSDYQALVKETQPMTAAVNSALLQPLPDSALQ